MNIIKPFMLENGLFRGSFISADDAISKMMENHTVIDNPDVDTILAVEEEVYNRISKEGI